MADLVATELERGVLTVTLDDPERRNVLSAPLVRALTATLDAAETDPTVRVIVLTNTGSTFCAGADLGERSGAADLGSPTDLFARFAASAKPYVGRIAGHCVAGGMGLAAAMDVAIAVDTAKFGFTEVRVGVAPAMISVVCLPKMRAGEARAAFLRGNRFDAAEAVRLGLIADAVPRDDLDAAVSAVVEDLLLGGPEAIAATKRILATVPSLPHGQAVEWTAALSARLFAGEEARAGLAAFLEKRPAPWAGGTS